MCIMLDDDVHLLSKYMSLVSFSLADGCLLVYLGCLTSLWRILEYFTNDTILLWGAAWFGSSNSSFECEADTNLGGNGCWMFPFKTIKALLLTEWVVLKLLSCEWMKEHGAPFPSSLDSVYDEAEKPIVIRDIALNQYVYFQVGKSYCPLPLLTEFQQVVYTTHTHVA